MITLDDELLITLSLLLASFSCSLNMRAASVFLFLIYIYIRSGGHSPYIYRGRDRAKVEILRIAVNPPVNGETQCVLHQD